MYKEGKNDQKKKMGILVANLTPHDNSSVGTQQGRATWTCGENKLQHMHLMETEFHFHRNSISDLCAAFSPQMWN